MAASIERNETASLIRLEGVCNVSTAAELKKLLVEGLTSSVNLTLDLDAVEEIDITNLQLLWAFARAASNCGRTVSVSRISQTALLTARQAGFDSFPGQPS